MDNITHSLVGLAAAKAGLERVSPYATPVCVIAANAPDCDLLGILGGRWFNFQHHRGITHSIVGVLALGLLLPTIFYAVDYWRAGHEGRPVRVRWGPLALVSLLLTASHPFLDWTNNYGVRPWLPWDGSWIYGDFAFVVEPFFWLTLGAVGFIYTARTRRRTILWAVWATLAFVLLLLAPLVRNVALPRFWPVVWILGAVAAWQLWRNDAAQRWGARVARVALLMLAVYAGLLWYAHRRALAAANLQAQRIAAQTGESLGKLAAMSLPGDPTRWLCLAETDKATYRYQVSLSGAEQPEMTRFAKLENREAELETQALQDKRARIWRGFARFPAARVTGDCVSETLVQFADLRYAEPGQGPRGSSFALSVPVACPPQKAEKTH